MLSSGAEVPHGIERRLDRIEEAKKLIAGVKHETRTYRDRTAELSEEFRLAALAGNRRAECKRRSKFASLASRARWKGKRP